MGVLSYSERERLLSKYGIKKPTGRLVKTKNEAVSLARKIGFPLVLKVNSSRIIHKTDVNGVKLNINNLKELESCYNEMAGKFKNQDVNGFLLQKMYEGHAVIIGMKRDKQFGPVIVFGFGGIFVELVKDVSYRVAPINIKEAEEMIHEIKMFPVLDGFRGGIKADIQKITELIVKVSNLVMNNKDIQELDFNPVIVNDKEAIPVDARIVKWI